jgi:hypothetical protein
VKLGRDLMVRAREGDDLDPGTVRFWAELCSRGGFLPADRIVNAVTARLRIMLDAHSVKDMDETKRKAFLELVAHSTADILAEPTDKQAPALPPSPGDDDTDPP